MVSESGRRHPALAPGGGAQRPVLTPLFTLYTHLGDSGLMWIALSVLLLCFKKTRKAGAAGLMALLLSLMFTNGILKHLVERPRPWLTVEG